MAVAAADHVAEVERAAGQLQHLRLHAGVLLLQPLLFRPQAFRLRRVHLAVVALHAREHRPQAVILPLRNGIDFVVVAAGAVDGDAHGRGDDLRHHVVEIAGAGGALQHVAPRLDVADEVPRPRRKKARRNQRRGISGRDDIAGNLLAEELPVGFVGVERGDHVVAVAPRVRAQLIALEAVGVGVVRDVEPVPRPALAVVRRGEQFIDELFVGPRVAVGDEALHALRRRR